MRLRSSLIAVKFAVRGGCCILSEVLGGCSGVR